jgi:signal transduction histidine kinase
MVEVSSETIGATSLVLEKESRIAFLNLILFSIAGFVISLFTGMVFVGKVIISPLNLLLEATNRLAKGDLNYRVPINTKDEIATLSETFNSMASNLVSHTVDLEREVEERTKKLEEHVATNKRQVENFAQLNKELNTGTTLLIRRDLELSRANEKLQKFDEIKSNFISIVAHQLRTPLSGVKWTLSMLLNGDMGPLTNDQKTFLMKTYESNARMIALVNDMLVVDRVQSGRVHYGFKHIDMVDLMDNVLFEISPQALKRNISIKYKNKFEHLPQAYIDPSSMRAVLQNLLENAIKYTMNGGLIELDVKVDGDYLMISVADNGIGIPKVQQKDIFAKFFRANNAVTQETDGSGLGLYISKSLVEKNGGKIWFESVPDKGSTFYFTVPLKEDNL